MRAYRWLLRVYPRWFLERYGEELADAFARDRSQPQYRGRLGLVRFWVYIVSDLACSAARVRTARPRGVGDSQPRRSAMESVLLDLRHAARLLARRPAFAAVAILSLALGIGGNAAIFALVDGFVLHPFPYPEPDRVIAIGVTFPRVSSEQRFIEAISPLDYLDIREARTIEAIAAFDLGNRNISGGDRPERVFTGLALTDPFSAFGLQPALGRGFSNAELQPNGPPAAILSYRIWQSRFGGDATIAGRSIRVNGQPATVVGVMPPELLILGTDLWIPWGGSPHALPRNARQFRLVGRFAPTATIEMANAELATIAASIAGAHAREFQEYDGWRIAARPWHEAVMSDARPAAFLLLAAVGLVLLIACANLSNLLLARSTTRQREMAVRAALGAGRFRIARHLVAEVLLLALAGAAVGLLLAHASLGALTSLVPAQIESLGLSASLSARVLAWTAVFTIGSALLVALLPVLQSTRTDPHQVLQTEARGTTASRGPRRMRDALIVVEIALSVMLLAGAGLLVRSFVKLRQVDPGIDTRDVLTMRITLPREKYSGAAGNMFFQQLIDRLADTPGIRVASVASQFPPSGPFTSQFRLEGADTAGVTLPTAMTTVASASHFATLGLPVVAGRGFTKQDRAAAPGVVVVNRAFATRFLPGRDPIGQRLRVGSPDRPSPPLEIVGVTADARNQGVTRPAAPEIFVPLHQQTINNQLFLLARTEGDATAMLDPVRRQIAAIDPEQPVYAIQTLEDAFAAVSFQQRLSMILLGVFAAVAGSLAAIGIYGVMSYAVSARTQEIGVRIAVGAERRQVLWLVLGQALRLTSIGLAIGIAAVIAGGGAMRGVLFDVRPRDPITIAGVTIVLGSVAVLAGWLPAWRASRIDPVEALRNE
jgi:putative ABC transport system permease protein